jgi:hypothetical protein
MDTNTKEEQQKNEHEFGGWEFKSFQETHKTNKYKFIYPFTQPPMLQHHLNSCTILHEYLPKPIYLVYHTHALHTYQKARNFETNNTLRV